MTTEAGPGRRLVRRKPARPSLDVAVLNGEEVVRVTPGPRAVLASQLTRLSKRINLLTDAEVTALAEVVGPLHRRLARFWG